MARAFQRWTAILLFVAAADSAYAIKRLSTTSSETTIGKHHCPLLCSGLGPDPRKWTTFQSMDKLTLCDDQVSMLQLPDFDGPFKACLVPGKDGTKEYNTFGETSTVKAGPLDFGFSGRPDGSTNSDEAFAAIQTLQSAHDQDHDSGTDYYSAMIFSAQASGKIVGAYFPASNDRRRTASEVLSRATAYIKTAETVSMLVNQTCGVTVRHEYITKVAINPSEFALDDIRAKLKTWSEATCAQNATEDRASQQTAPLWLTEGNDYTLEKIVDENDIATTAEGHIQEKKGTDAAEPFQNVRVPHLD